MIIERGLQSGLNSYDLPPEARIHKRVYRGTDGYVVRFTVPDEMADRTGRVRHFIALTNHPTVEAATKPWLQELDAVPVSRIKDWYMQRTVYELLRLHLGPWLLRAVAEQEAYERQAAAELGITLARLRRMKGGPDE